VPDLPSGTFGEVPSFASGTGGRYLNFGSGTLAMLHGRERVSTSGEGGEMPSNASLLAEVAGLRRDMAVLVPGLIASATTTALVKAGVRR
jgi:hypothetical protein